MRPTAAVLCGALGIAAILVAGFLAYGSRVLFDSAPFADRVADSLEDPRVASFVAGHLTDGVLAQKPDLTMLRPLILASSEAVVSSAPARAVVRRAAREAHEVVMSRGTETVLLSVGDLGLILRSALATQPELADAIPEDAGAVVANLQESPILGWAARLLPFGRRLQTSSRLVLYLGILLVLASVMIAANRRSAMMANGVGLAAVAVVILVIAQFGGGIAADLTTDDALGDALAGLWDSFAAGLIPRALAIGGVGLLFSAAAAALFERVQLLSRVRAAALLLWDPPARRGAELLRAMALILIGGATVLSPSLAVGVLTVLVGAVVLFLGLQELFRLVLPALPASMLERGPEPDQRRGPSVGRAAVATIVLAGIVVGGFALFDRSEAAETVFRSINRCNGYASLCGRRLDGVALPGTHNSMAAAAIPGWLFPNQEQRIPQQLQDGIRAFMIDVHAGITAGDHIKTEVDDEEAARVKYEAVLGSEGVDAALRIRNRLIGEEEGERGLYLCHGFCELGAEPLVPVLREIREFLVMNPHEVIVLIFEDPGANAQQMESAFLESGLIDFVYRGPVTPPWPTLREMIGGDERVLVLSENAWPGVPWYHAAFEVEQETPYTFEDPSAFSCRLNRGEPTASLLVINHWISTPPAPRPSNAELVNAFDPLLARARECQRERGMLPNVIAVDFYGRGDVVGVARELNGLNGQP